MCRVLLMNKKGESEIEKIYGLEKYLKFLENQLGGHGNGFALLKNEKIIKFEKGVNLDVKDIAKTIQETDYDWCLFHTRLASVGIKTDSNCHPFKRGDTIIAMNGTEKSVSFISEVKEITDTEAILDLMSKYNLGLAALKRFSSIFMGFYKGKPFVVADNTVNIEILKDRRNEALVFASNFPRKFRSNIFIPDYRFIWNGGRLPNMTKRSNNIYKSPMLVNDYIFDTDLYGQYYIDAYNKKGGVKYGV